MHKPDLQHLQLTRKTVVLVARRTEFLFTLIKEISQFKFYLSIYNLYSCISPEMASPFSIPPPKRWSVNCCSNCGKQLPPDLLWIAEQILEIGGNSEVWNQTTVQLSIRIGVALVTVHSAVVLCWKIKILDWCSVLAHTWYWMIQIWDRERVDQVIPNFCATSLAHLDTIDWPEQNSRLNVWMFWWWTD